MPSKTQTWDGKLPVLESSFEASESWPKRYERLGLARLSPTAQKVVLADSDGIAKAAGLTQHLKTPCSPGRVRTGIVVGAVQSGKTASMLGAVANLLDDGCDIIVVLAGTRLALWRQTYERFVRELDGGWDGLTQMVNSQLREIVPRPSSYEATSAMPKASGYIASGKGRLTEALAERRPIICVIPKIEHHLLELSRAIEDVVGQYSGTDRNFHLVVFDDEADDASVLDANDSKTIPRRIEMLWSGMGRGQTCNANLYATYIAYTATPQANFLQESLNPLSPTDFCLALRTPYKSGTTGLVGRTTTFAEPKGLKAYYCGGEFFYAELAGAASYEVVPFPTPDQFPGEAEWAEAVAETNNELILDALRAYLVSAALRLRVHRAKGGQSYPSEADERIWSKDEVDAMPSPHSMLVHPAVQVEEHFRVRSWLALWSRGLNPDHSDIDEQLLEEAAKGRLGLDPYGMRNRMDANEPAWSSWLDRYAKSLDAATELPLAGYLKELACSDWPAIRKLILDEIVPAVRLKVINSDEKADDRPSFEPLAADGGLKPPQDLLTIFISGNVLSRGITLEGLATSVFLRTTKSPAADTQMQMQRWFGYRGQVAHFVRLFTYNDQLELFKTYHEHDVLVRREILRNMDLAENGQSPTGLLHGHRSWATNKVPSRKLSLHPGPSPSVLLLEPAHGNQAVLTNLLSESKARLVPLHPKFGDKGKILDQTLRLREVADVLDQFQYAAHDPTASSGDDYERWSTLNKRYNLPISAQVFRPDVEGSNCTGKVAVGPNSCPYSIAAYLRLWALALEQPELKGLFAIDCPSLPWAVEGPTMSAPEFYVGIRNGSQGPSNLVPGIRTMRRDSFKEVSSLELSTLWGSNPAEDERGAYFGDKRFDYHFSGVKPPMLPAGREALWRPRGHPGLLLFHIIRPISAPEKELVTVALCLPQGGPNQIAALR